MNNETYKYFDISEFDCTETGENEMKPRHVHRVDALRGRCGFPFIVVSGFRSKLHSKEVIKENGPGEHPEGHATDIRVTNGVQRREIVEWALKMDFRGIGVAKTFVHVDDRLGTPVLWPY